MIHSSQSPWQPGRRALPKAEVLEVQSVFLIFVVDEQSYACKIDQVKTLMRFVDVDVQPAPTGAEPWVTGQMAFEGRNIPIFSLRALWQLPPLPPQMDKTHEALLIWSAGGETRAILVDFCRRIVPGLPPESARFQIPRELKGPFSMALKSATPWEDTLLVVVEFNELFENGSGAHLEPLSR